MQPDSRASLLPAVALRHQNETSHCMLKRNSARVVSPDGSATVKRLTSTEALLSCPEKKPVDHARRFRLEITCHGSSRIHERVPGGKFKRLGDERPRVVGEVPQLTQAAAQDGGAARRAFRHGLVNYALEV